MPETGLGCELRMEMAHQEGVATVINPLDIYLKLQHAIKEMKSQGPFDADGAIKVKTTDEKRLRNTD